MLLMTSNTRSGGGGQGRASLARRAAGEAKRRALTDDGAQGIRPRMLKGCVFNTFTRSNRHVYAPEPRTHRFASNCLIPFTFTHSNL
jgi:hypothetical protein